MTLTNRIEVNPRVMLGKAVIRGTRIPVELLLRKLSEGASEADLMDAYPRLTRDDIHAATRYARVYFVQRKNRRVPDALCARSHERGSDPNQRSLFGRKFLLV